jgi:SAM-dependent methyltransferase
MKRVVARELMDDRIESVSELEENLADIEFANRTFGGIAPVLREIRRCGARTLLDVCCGSADVPLAIARDARGRGASVALTVLDCSEEMLTIARRRGRAEPGITFTVGNATALPFSDAAFDAVTCNLALHHFEPAAACALLRELRRVARVLPLVCDLRRSPLAFAAALGWSQLFSRNRLTRHDAPLSVRRAYTAREARALAFAAGWAAPRVRAEPFFRMTIADESSPALAGTGG